MLNTPITNHDIYMKRCLTLAALGAGCVAPNPMVGAILVANGKIIGEGWHKQYGGAHAEIEALKSIRPEYHHLLPTAKMYVTLEPCSHFGKTPPCTEAIIKNNIRHVIVACTDPFPSVAGSGIQCLRQAGIEVEEGVLRKDAWWLNRRFMTFYEKQRPYIILKWAQTADGFFAPHDGQQQWISNPQTQILAHRWRSEEAAVMIGTNTLIVDNPHLNVRYWPTVNIGNQLPLRITIDPKGQLYNLSDKKLHFFDGQQPSLVFCGQNISSVNIKNLKYVCIESLAEINSNRPNKKAMVLAEILAYLTQQKILSLFVEGGRQLLDSFLANDLFDEVRIFEAPTHWGKGIKAPKLPASVKLVESYYLGDNKVVIWKNR